MKLYKFIKGAIALWSILFAANLTSAQELNEILQNANLQAQKYTEEFKNLLADETKTFETYDKNGKLKKGSVIESNFFVLQSEKSGNVTSEYRSVTKVDGKSVGDSEKRSADLFEQIAKAKSPAEELERIQKESSRYDKNIEISGFTLIQAPNLDESLRSFFEFNSLGIDHPSYSLEKIEGMNGRKIFVFEYRQTKASPNISINQKKSNQSGLNINLEVDLPDSFKKSDVFLRGTLWIDAETFQIWREEREVAAEKDKKLIVLQRTVFEYQPSEYGILLPKQITFLQNKAKKVSGSFVETKIQSIVFQYSRWRKSNVDVQILDDN